MPHPCPSLGSLGPLCLAIAGDMFPPQTVLPPPQGQPENLYKVLVIRENCCRCYECQNFFLVSLALGFLTAGAILLK